VAADFYFTGRLELKLEAQCELHNARLGKKAAVVPERDTLVDVRGDGLGVKPRQVQHIENFPAELQALRLLPGHHPAFAKACIQPRESIAPDGIACTAFSGQRTNKSADPSWPLSIAEYIHRPRRQPGRILCRPCRCRSDLRGVGRKLPVCRPGAAISNVYRETSRPTRQSGELPATDECIEESVGITGDQLSFTERQLHDPIGVDLMRRIEIGDSPELLGSPGILDEAVRTNTEQIYALGIGFQVN
jgi:hypothetical protein